MGTSSTVTNTPKLRTHSIDAEINSKVPNVIDIFTKLTLTNKASCPAYLPPRLRNKRPPNNKTSIYKQPTPTPAEKNMPVPALEAVALKCLQSGDYSDLTITCKGKEFKVHKFVLCTQSAFFARAVKKDAFEEGQTGVISMNHDDPDAIEAVLRFLYTGDYNTESVIMQSHLKIYELADRLDIPALKTLSENKFEVLAKNEWKEATFPPCVKIAYDITPPGPGGERLRSMVVQIASQHLKELFNLDIGFKNMMIEVPGFGGDLAEVLAGATSTTERSPPSTPNATYECDRCLCILPKIKVI
ncbi:hypothetical protein Vi05172_g11352 [Venturia inaequalis]|nr:hypothetical protein Vi05172_g11352 [Venturia inaequalis]